MHLQILYTIYIVSYNGICVNILSADIHLHAIPLQNRLTDSRNTDIIIKKANRDNIFRNRRKAMKVRFHLPDFSGSFKLNLLFAEMLRNHPEFFREGTEIASVYGVFPPCLWNGGRSQGGNADKNYIKTVIREFNSRGIPLRFTFTNIMLEKKHLSDERCNMILHYADNGMNEVIVASQLLEDYIRKEYPGYKLTSSTCKRLDSKEALLSELQKDYHVVVADYDLNNKFDILNELPRKKDIEFLVNACCQPECPGRFQHYKDISQQQIAFCNHIKKYPTSPLMSKSTIPTTS